jgi:hypothetical protein
VAVGLVLLPLLLVADLLVELIWNRMFDFTGGVPAAAPAVALFLLAALSRNRALRRVGLTRRELLVIYAMLLVASPLVSHGILFWMLPKTIIYSYMARAQPAMETTVLPHVPVWFAPTAPAAVNGFFEGNAPVPWAAWWVPLTAWSLFLLCLFGAVVGLLGLLQRQWIVNERLSFPLAQVPLQMVQEAPGAPAGGLPRLPLFWLGVGTAFVIALLNGLSARYPSVPAIPLGPVPLMAWTKVGPLAGLGQIDLVLYPWLIALSYLLPRDISFSCWFFWVVRLGLTVAAVAAGGTPRLPEEWYDSDFPAPFYQGLGAILALGLSALWIARRHLWRALKSAVHPPSTGDEQWAPLSYRWAVLGTVCCLCGLVYFCWLAGCRPLFGLGFALVLVAYYLVWARLRAETGLGFVDYPLSAFTVMTVGWGSAALRPRELVTLISARWAYTPAEGQSLDICTAGALEAFKIADSAHINARRMTAAIAVAVLVSLVLSAYLLLTAFYHYGYMGFGRSTAADWPGGQTRSDAEHLAHLLTSPDPGDLHGVIAILAGAAVTLCLSLLRLRLWWWPLHPAGYLAANTWDMHWYYMPFLVGWAAKSLVTRYGGLQLFRRTTPLAIGVIVGDLLNQGLWAAVTFATGGHA